MYIQSMLPGLNWQLPNNISRTRRCMSDNSRTASCCSILLLATLLMMAQCSHAADDFGRGWTPTALDLAGTDMLTLVFPLMPLHQQPSLPLAYNRAQMRNWSFRGGPGLVLVTRHLVAPFRILSELFYMPGLYQASCGLRMPTLYSTQRVWVDMEISRDVGRQVWGYPKEMASFEWGTHSVVVRNTSGSVIFSAKLSTSSLLGGAVPAWLSSVAKGSITTVQWPIPEDSSSSSSRESSSRMAATAAAGGVKPAAAATQAVPNIQELRFDPDELFVTQALHPTIDSVAFTGRKGQTEFMPQAPVGVILGSPGVLSLPVPLKC